MENLFCFLFRDLKKDDLKSKKLYFNNGFEVVMTIFIIIATLIIIGCLLL